MKLKLFFIFLLSYCITYAQIGHTMYFDGNDTASQGILQLVTDTTGLWQVGPPQKSLFDSAATSPNALITDTLNSYPVNMRSGAIIKIENFWFFNGILAFQWMQKLDFEDGKDGGLLEFSTDYGLSWENAFNNPYVYNFYGYKMANVDTIGNNKYGFTGTDSSWSNIWLCFDPNWISTSTDTVFLRFSIVSDSVDTQNEGWMIDNFMAHLTWVHTLTEKPSENVDLSPNPTKDRLNIQIRNQSKFQLIEDLHLINADGRLVQEWKNIPRKFFIEIGHHPAGTYMLRLMSENFSEVHQIVIE